MLRRHLVPVLAVALVAAGLGLLAGCGAEPRAAYDDADVTFASEMTAHHQQAIDMVTMTEGRSLDPAFRAFAAQVRDAQQPEIDQMSGWLEEWGKPAPTASTDADGAMGEMNMGGSMAGMMSADEMDQLDAAGDASFEPMWLQLMIEHHRGALDMARDEIADGRYAPAVELARLIVATQSAEITQMQAMLGS